MYSTVGILPTGAGKSLIVLPLSRILDIMYGRGARPMRTYVCVALKGCVAWSEGRGMGGGAAISHWNCHCCRLEQDQVNTANGYGGPCARAVSLSADDMAADVAAAF